MFTKPFGVVLELEDVEIIPMDTRACDLCNDKVTDEVNLVTKSFVLTDWGVICVECWDKGLVHREEFLVEKVYIKSMKIQDEWVTRPLVFTDLEERRD